MSSRGYFSSLTKEQEDTALLNKLAVQESSFNRLSNLLSRLVQASPSDDLQSIQADLDEEFVNFDLATIKAQTIRNVNEKEIQRYNAEKQKILENSRHAQAEITSLREELKEAKEVRSQKVQYDEFTRAMLKKTPKSRAEQITTIEKLTVELEELESELSSYSTVWDARKSTFDSILNNLDVLRREVEDEKEQQDRKEGMNEGSEHEEEEGQATGAQTPAIKESEEERHVREGSRDSGEVDEDAREDAAFPEEEMKDEDTKEELMSTFPSTFPSRIPTEANTPRGKNGELDTEDGDETDEVRMVETELKMDVD